MATTEEILCGIEKGGTLDELADTLDMSKSMLMVRIEFLVRAGYLCEVSSGEGCKGCPMSETCCVPAPEGSGKVKIYVLTEKSREYIKDTER
ncbi:hypothetical protein C5S30_04540 [ANME-1 cluster archaeon GoMg4]|nr:hypothetical protein [ANME-1 cluster archaeon GoMg4]